MRIALCFSLSVALSAQVWVAPGVHVTREASPIPTGPLGHLRSVPGEGMALVRAGRSGEMERLPIPPSLYPQRWSVRLSHWQGISHAEGWLNHPGMGLRALFRLDKKRGMVRADQLTRHLYRSDDFKTWKPFATYQDDPHGRVRQFLPLENGTFLATGGPFWVGEVLSPYALYARDGEGRMRLLRLLDPGLGQPLYHIVKDAKGGRRVETFPGMQAWSVLNTVHRGPHGLLLLASSGHHILFDNRDGRALRHGSLFPGLQEGYFFGHPKAVLGSALRPDGQLLLALRSADWIREAHRPLWELEVQFRDQEASRRALALLSLRGRQGARFDTTDHVGKHPHIHWALLDPTTGRLKPVAPPGGFPNRPLRDGELMSFRFSMGPDGNLTWSFER